VRTIEVTSSPPYQGADGARHSELLTARNLAALLRAAGLPCVTLTTEGAAAAEPASTEDEGLRIVAGSFPVRVFYAIPPENNGARRRRDAHLMWLHDFTERHRWSTRQDAGDGWITVHPEPWPATYVLDGRECFRATGRRVDENLGSHVVLWIVDDAEAWAGAIEAEVASEIARAPRGRRFATYMQQQRLEAAARIRAAGPGRSVYSVHHDEARARDGAASLRQGQPNPGVRYEAAPVTATAACTKCFCPMICADGQWWHHTGGYPAGCPGRRARSLPLEPGDWEISGIDMTCGYCGQCVTWPETQRSWARLTGVHSLGVHRQTGELVVLAEVTGVAARPGEPGHLAHHCTQIPGSVRAEYAADIRAVTEGGTSHMTQTVPGTDIDDALDDHVQAMPEYRSSTATG
jgi:hypothetical protein